MRRMSVRIMLSLAVFASTAMTVHAASLLVEEPSSFCGVAKELCFPFKSDTSFGLVTEAGGQVYDGSTDINHDLTHAYFALDFDLRNSGFGQVLAARQGVIVEVKPGPNPNEPDDKYWPVIRIDHGSGYFTEYAEFSSLAKTPADVGETVPAGEVLGFLNAPNQRAIGADHLHFQVKYDAAYMPDDPNRGGATGLSVQTIPQLGDVKVGGKLIKDYVLSPLVLNPTPTPIDLRPAHINGTFGGVFANPDPACTGIFGPQCTGIGTNDITWGLGLFSPPSGLLFTGAAFDAAVGQPFTLGTLTFTNGQIFAGTEIDGVTLKLTTGTTDHSLADNLTLDLAIGLINTPNIGSPEQSADQLFFPGHPEWGTFAAYEGQTSTVSLRAQFGSLTFLGLGEVDDPSTGFIDRPEPLPEPEPGPGVVPEPATLILAGFGVMGFSVLRRRFA